MASKEDVLKELRNRYYVAEVKDDELTRHEMLDYFPGYSESMMWKLLRQMVEEGWLDWRWAIRRKDRQKVKAYTPAEGHSWESIAERLKEK